MKNIPTFNEFLSEGFVKNIFKPKVKNEKEHDFDVHGTYTVTSSFYDAAPDSPDTVEIGDELQIHYEVWHTSKKDKHLDSFVGYLIPAKERQMDPHHIQIFRGKGREDENNYKAVMKSLKQISNATSASNAKWVIDAKKNSVSNPERNK